MEAHPVVETLGGIPTYCPMLLNQTRSCPCSRKRAGGKLCSGRLYGEVFLDIHTIQTQLLIRGRQRTTRKAPIIEFVDTTHRLRLRPLQLDEAPRNHEPVRADALLPTSLHRVACSDVGYGARNGAVCAPNSVVML